MNINSEKTEKISGFILQKDVYTTNLLYENDLLQSKGLKYILPFRPKSGRIPQDPSPCLKILKQNIFIPYDIKIEENIFKGYKTKKLRKKKLKFPLPKHRLRPISSNDFYKNYRGDNLNILNIEDDLNITSKHGKKIHYSFKNENENENKKFKEKYVKVGYDNFLNNNINNYDEYFDFRFHINKNPKQKIKIKSISNIKRKPERHHQKMFAKDNTFKTQIDYNLLFSNKSNNNFMNINRTKSAKNDSYLN